MSLRMQTLLLRFLENGEYHPVGSDATASRADVHVISATNRDLRAMVASGHFREDLLYRIQVVHIEVPPLRERKEDIRPLIEHAVAAADSGVTIDEEALSLLEQYRWPGNVRELQNVVEQLVAMAVGVEITADQLPPAVASVPGNHLYSRRERRRRKSDELFDLLVSGQQRFWDDVHTQFLNRDITRADIRHLLRRALETSGGSYRTVLQLFGMEPVEYKKLMNFLAAHECVVDYREFRKPRESVRSARDASYV
jgi:DNA-binding NtrC family response regulator